MRQDLSTQAFDGGTVLLGGSPLRLFRISERARQLLDLWKNGAEVGPRRSAQLLARRLASGGAFNPRPTSSTLGLADVTVVVPVHNRPAPLDRLLARVEDQGLGCIVVDDASADAGATKEIAERHGAAFVGLAVNVGPAGARNAGLAAVHSALVAFVDSDCVPRDGWLAPLLGHFDDPVVAAVAPRIVPGAAGTCATKCARSSLDRGPLKARSGRGAAFPSCRARPWWSGSSWRRDPTSSMLRCRGGEDVDLVWRLVEAGWDVRYVPASTVAHDGPATLGGRSCPPVPSTAPRRLRWPGATRRAWPRSTSPAGPGGVDPRCWRRRPLLALAALAGSVAILARRLRGLVRDPVAVAAHIAGRRHGALGAAGARVPGAGVVSPPRPRAGLPPDASGVGARVAPPRAGRLVARRSGRPGTRPVALHVADDVAYGVGVWRRLRPEGRSRPLIPRCRLALPGVVGGRRCASTSATDRRKPRRSTRPPGGGRLTS